MKKIFLTVAVLFMLAGQCFGADASSVVTSDTWVRNSTDGSVTQRVIVCTFTCATAAATFTDLTFTITNKSIDMTVTDGTTSSTLTSLEGWWLYQVDVNGNGGGTEPTEDSDLYIWRGTVNTIDILGGSGVNKVDNSDENSVFAIDGVASIYGAINETFLVDISGNSVNNAVVVLTMIFVPRR